MVPRFCVGLLVLSIATPYVQSAPIPNGDSVQFSTEDVNYLIFRRGAVYSYAGDNFYAPKVPDGDPSKSGKIEVQTINRKGIAKELYSIESGRFRRFYYTSKRDKIVIVAVVEGKNVISVIDLTQGKLLHSTRLHPDDSLSTLYLSNDGFISISQTPTCIRTINTKLKESETIIDFTKEIAAAAKMDKFSVYSHFRNDNDKENEASFLVSGKQPTSIKHRLNDKMNESSSICLCRYDRSMKSLLSTTPLLHSNENAFNEAVRHKLDKNNEFVALQLQDYSEYDIEKGEGEKYSKLSLYDLKRNKFIFSDRYLNIFDYAFESGGRYLVAAVVEEKKKGNESTFISSALVYDTRSAKLYRSDLNDFNASDAWISGDCKSVYFTDLRTSESKRVSIAFPSK